MRTLNLKVTNLREIRKNWNGIGVSALPKSLVYYVRCNAKGEVKWSSAPIYTQTEILSRIRNGGKTVINGTPDLFPIDMDAIFEIVKEKYPSTLKKLADS